MLGEVASRLGRRLAGLQVGRAVQDDRVAPVALRTVDIGRECDAIAHRDAPIEVDPDLVSGLRGAICRVGGHSSSNRSSWPELRG